MNYIDLNSDLSIEPSKTKNETAVMNSLNNIISTRKGSVPGHPEFGSDLGKYLFELMNPLTIELIKEEIKYSIDRWEPRVTIKNIEIIDDLDYNRILIKVYFTIKSDVNNTELTYIYKATK
jgi:phage baseplate assembly protein W